MSYYIVDNTQTLSSNTTAITDGKYTIDIIDEGTYQLSFENIKFQTNETNNIILINNTRLNANVALTSQTGLK